MVGCKHFRSISWPQTRMRQLRLLCIDTRSSGQEVARKPSPGDSLMGFQDRGEEEYLHAFVDVADTRFLQSLEFLWITTPQLKMDLCLSSTSISNDDERSCHEKMGCTNSTSTGQLLAAGLPLPYRDVCLVQTATKIDGSSSAMQFQPLDFHMEIGDGISDITNVATTQARRPISMVMNRVESLHVHDSSSITTVVPEYILLTNLLISYVGSLNRLKWCRVERCPKLDNVLATNKDPNSFFKLKTFWAAHLLMARSIWSGSPTKRGLSVYGYGSFIKLRVIHIHSCPRLTFVLPLSSNHFLSYGLETLHIFCCGDLRQIFPVEQEFQEEIAATHETKGMPVPARAPQSAAGMRGQDVRSQPRDHPPQRLLEPQVSPGHGRPPPRRPPCGCGLREGMLGRAGVGRDGVWSRPLPLPAAPLQVLQEAPPARHGPPVIKPECDRHQLAAATFSW
ncbi:hypothetical protein PAHAL_6G035100 [Panicum hallii]|uniref:Uncharacterized protein n=1 Tax=Panicum hallii TaxID=206008 RepID=A0A2T8IF04_9POAL|nr:hypothetical protein PAHAL_6G035100 [Panicum hallii]